VSAPRSLAELGTFRLLAHHPDCARHDHHLLRPLGVPICLGCAGVGLGFIAAATTLLLHDPRPPVPAMAVASLLALAPTFAQPWIQRRWFKLPSRMLLGASCALAAAILLVAPLSAAGAAQRAAVLVIGAVLYRAATAVRQRTPDPCRACPWGAFPLCAHNLPALEALAAKETDPGQRAFLDAVVGDLRPLASISPSMEGPYPGRKDARVGFEAR
jgi:hypothetical protein